MEKSLLFLVLFFPFVLTSQLKGKIIDAETKEPIPFVSVYLSEIGTGTVANKNGEFEWTNNLPINAKIEFKALGYTTKIIVFTRSSVNDSLIVSLFPKHYHLHEAVVSSGTGIIQDYSISPIVSKSLSELTIIKSTNLGESISLIEGVYNASTGKGIYKPVIRGLSGSRILTFLNGVRIENQQWGSDHGLGLSSIGIGQVEIIKGPSSLLYGADALGGVLYLREEPFTKNNTIDISANSQYESNTNGIKNDLAFKWNKNNFRINVFANQESHADYQIPDGRFVKSSRFNGNGAKVLLGYNVRNWSTKLGYVISQNTIGIPGHTHDSIVNTATFLRENQVREEGRPSQKINNQLISFDNLFFFQKSSLKITLGQGINKTEEYEKFTIPQIGVKLNTSSYYVRYSYKYNSKVDILAGGQGFFQQNKNIAEAEEELIPDNTSIDNGLFSILNIKNKKLNYQFGIRADNRNIIVKNVANSEFQYFNFNYSGGASYTNKNVSFHLNVSSGIRNPHVSELLSQGGHSSAQRYEIGKIDLVPEKASQLDVSIIYENEHVNLIFNPFFNYIHNYIYLQPVDSSIQGFQVFYYTQSSNTRLYGGEITFHYHPHFLHDFHIESNFSFVNGTNQDNKPLPMIPQPRLITLLTNNFDYEQTRLFAVKNISLQHQFFADQNRTTLYELPSKSYHIFNFSVNNHLNIFHTIVDLSFGINNVLNTAYIDHLSTLKNYQIPNPGRNYYLSIGVNINKKTR